MEFLNKDVKLAIIDFYGFVVGSQFDFEDNWGLSKSFTKEVFRMLLSRDVLITLIIDHGDTQKLIEFMDEEDGLSQYFDKIYTFDENETHLEKYEKITKEYNLNKEEVMIIEDDLINIDALHKQGYLAVLIGDYYMDQVNGDSTGKCDYHADCVFDLTQKLEEDVPLPELEIDNFRVKKQMDGWSILGLINPVKTLHIPATLDGKRVYKIDREAFKDQELDEIILPEGLLELFVGAFDGVKGPKELTIPSTVNEASLFAIGIPTLEILNLLGYISDTTTFLYDMENLKHLNFPEGWKQIRMRGFWCLHALEEVELKEGLEVIGTQGFNFCDNLKVVHLPHSIKRIQDNAFYRCFKLETVYYHGTPEDKEKIVIINEDNGNDLLINANWIYI